MSIARHDDIYEALIAAQDGMDEAESLRFSARLVLVLIDRIGCDDVVLRAIAEVRQSFRESGSDRRA